MTPGLLAVVGAGPAAAAAVSAARQAGWSGEVVVVGDEEAPPYDRTLLSKRYLVEDLAPDKLSLPPVEADLRLGTTVTALHVEEHEIELEGGERLGYERLLLATGARARSLPDYPDGLYLRHRPDADRLRALLSADAPLEIVGAGFIGCEVAAAGRTRGREVVVYERLAQPLLRVLGAELGQRLADLHRQHGVDLRTGADELPEPSADLVVGVGSVANQELAEDAGIECDSGIVVDEYGRTSAADVYAAGDCSRFWSPALESRIRVEHFQTAQRHGRSVGRNLAAPDAAEPFAQWPWFWTDQYDLNLQYLGGGLPFEELRYRGDPAQPSFTAFQLQDDRVVGVLSWNDGRTMTQVRRILERGLDVGMEQLCDPAMDLRALARS